MDQRINLLPPENESTGGYAAEFVIVDRDRLLPAPEGFDDRLAATTWVRFLTRLFKSGPASTPDGFVTLSEVARIGGDKFALFYGRPNGEDGAEVLAQCVLDNSSLPRFETHGFQL